MIVYLPSKKLVIGAIKLGAITGCGPMGAPVEYNSIRIIKQHPDPCSLDTFPSGYGTVH